MNPIILSLILAACSQHPTPPPNHYVQRGVASISVIGINIIQADDAKRACANVGIPHAGACGWTTTTFNMIVPTGNYSAMCHELGHLGGWNAEHNN